jgi:hypothetical protein
MEDHVIDQVLAPGFGRPLFRAGAAVNFGRR